MNKEFNEKKEYNGEEISPEEKVRYSRRVLRRERERMRRRSVRQMTPFLVSLALVTVIAWLLPLRPTVSEAEKRPLKEFPEFSVETLLSGEYFHNIDGWFTDTFTFREFWVNSTQKFKSLYGIQTVAVYGDIGANDAVPVVPTVAPVVEVTPAPTPAPDGTTPEPTLAPTPSPTPEPTPEPTPTPWGGEMIQEDEYVGQGAVLQIGNAAYKITGFSQYYADQYIAAINKLAEKLDGVANLYCMLVPENTTFMLRASDREKYGCVLEEDVLEYMYSQMTDTVKTVNIIDNLVAHNSEYIAFRTDHHWTALGAYYAYEVWCQEAGVEPVPLSEYEEIEWPGFLGTYFYKANQSQLMSKTPDTVYAYYPPGDVHLYLDFANSDHIGYENDVIVDRTHSEAGGKYLTFLGSDSAKSTFVNNAITDGSACMVIKTSLGNPWVYYMTQHYQYVYVVDARYYGHRSIASFVEEFGVQDVIFAHGTGLTQSSGGTGLVSYLCR